MAHNTLTMKLDLVLITFVSFLVFTDGFNLYKLNRGSSSHTANYPRQGVDHGGRRQEDSLDNIFLGFGDTSYPRGLGARDSSWGGGEQFDLQDDNMARREFLLVNIILSWNV